jgi:hypothetical protein
MVFQGREVRFHRLLDGILPLFCDVSSDIRTLLSSISGFEASRIHGDGVWLVPVATSSTILSRRATDPTTKEDTAEEIWEY